MDVSIVIPMFNAENTIDDQLKSLLMQEFNGAWEIVIVDNRSADASVSRVQAWQAHHNRVRTVTADEKRGPAYARNQGAYASSGRLIAFCDADDMVAPDWLASMWAAANMADVIVAVEDHGTLNGWAPELRAISTTKFPYLPWSRGGNIAVTRRAFEKIGGWDEERRIGEDVEFSWRLQCAGYRIVLAERALMYYRHPEGVKEIVKQKFKFGRNAAGLYRDFSSEGATRLRASKCLASLVNTLMRPPLLDFAPGRLKRWLGTVAGQLGRLWGALTINQSMGV